MIAAHVTNDLEPEDRVRVALHLETCDSCRKIAKHADAVAATHHADTHATNVPGAAATTSGNANVLPAVLAGRYEIKRLVGTGGMGSVYDALDLSLHRLVALKVLRVATAGAEAHSEAVTRLVREARSMAVLSHKNVVAVYDVGFHEDQVFVAMQLVDGTTLRAWLAAEPRSVHAILRVLLDAGNGLAAAHSARLIHRDFKPDNVMISQRGTARVTDFGLARRADLAGDAGLTTTERLSGPKMIDDTDLENVTRSGAIVGTPAYMAPEQSSGAVCDARADQFSFCVTAWEALFGCRPFAGGTWSEIYGHVIHQQITVPPTHTIPRSVQRALRRGLRVDPNERFPGMTALLEVLEAEIQRPIRRKQIAIAAASACAVIAAIAITARLREPDESGGEPGDSKRAPAVVHGGGSGHGVSVDVASGRTPGSGSVSSGAAGSSGGGVGSGAVVHSMPGKGAGSATTASGAAGSGAAPGAGSALADATRGSSTAPVKPRVKPRVAAVAPNAGSGSAAGETPPATTGDPRLAELKTARDSLDGERRAKELLNTDLPPEYRAAIMRADDALMRGDVSAAADGIAAARKAIASVVIDRGFIDQKLQRLNAQVQRLPEPKQFQPMLAEVLALVGKGDHAGANRKVNQIVSRLGVRQ
ncbi:MAG: protein kinase [Deltaproteobacteria bacterium]|nr:protein kinase [Deltaproteobacteria bacterium]